jgi:REP element-mobilizing transposase RayT
MLYTACTDEPCYKSNRTVFSVCHEQGIWCPKCRRKVHVSPLDERLNQRIGLVCEDHNAQMEALEVLADYIQ